MELNVSFSQFILPTKNLSLWSHPPTDENHFKRQVETYFLINEKTQSSLGGRTTLGGGSLV